MMIWEHMNYNNPTIIEALCEFRFAHSQNWDSTIYGEFWNKIKDKYPNKEERKQVSLGIQIGPNGQQGPSEINESAHMLFKTSDEKSLVQLQSNLLTVNTLAPYSGWNGFKPKVESAFSDFSSLGNFPLQRVGLRYINRLPKMREGHCFSQWLSNSPYISEIILEKSEGQGIHSRVSIPEDDNRISVTVSTELPSGDDLFIDIDSSHDLNLASEVKNMGELLETLHYNLIEAYESLITNELREVMGVKNA